VSKAYYNEIDPHAAQVLRNLIAAGLLPDGYVDDRSIVDVRPADLAGFVQCHFFAGIGGWPATLRRIGWRDDRAVWTASLPCQPFSSAGKKRGFDDPRHMWPTFEHLVGECRPAVIFGEQSSNANAWLGVVRSRLDSMAYSVGAIPLEAASAGAEHRRNRYYFVADDDDIARRLEQQFDGRAPERAWDESDWSPLGHAAGHNERRTGLGGCAGEIPHRGPDAGDGLVWVVDNKGKARRAPPGIRSLADGVSGKVDRRDAEGQTSYYSRVKALKGFGNAIDLRPASAFVAACMEVLVPIMGWGLIAMLMVAAAIAFGSSGSQPG
jgi:DNA (cytosine-5)-methyltransferase 1